ncbi:hypothetical protein TNIN_393271 [Trichonephila inaurata madagascariensis]|uniref:Uncharacterized protein n=1 Tax=Trichonephila inaurata madagascariensis TaxID=2747483 RepID=A0A8X7CV00_9ARAC|nr:hypothetical protein TNIN_393271 [Trichonephila inaurata madagascariensis]
MLEIRVVLAGSCSLLRLKRKNSTSSSLLDALALEMRGGGGAIYVATRRFSEGLGKSVGNVRDGIDRDSIAYKHGDWASTVFSTELTDFVPNLFT